jgi:hypothetical protein
MQLLLSYGFVLFDVKTNLKQTRHEQINDENFGQFTEIDAIYVHKSNHYKTWTRPAVRSLTN